MVGSSRPPNAQATVTLGTQEAEFSPLVFPRRGRSKGKERPHGLVNLNNNSGLSHQDHQDNSEMKKIKTGRGGSVKNRKTIVKSPWDFEAI